MWVEGRGHLPGQLVVVSGPSGCGKSTVVRRALERLGPGFQLSVSATTRERRDGEEHGVHYFFLSPDEFADLRVAGGFLEFAEYNQRCYGTPAAPVYDALAANRTVLLEIEVEGAKQVREQAPGALFVFIKAPSFRTLETRLRGRGTESEPNILRRLRKARQELAEAHWYDHQIINDDLGRCVDEFVAILKSYGPGG